MADVLIIDDDTAAAGALVTLLRREGHEARHAAGAGEALTSLREDAPDLILLDLTMPSVDGLDLLDALKDEPRFQGLRIAIFSGRDDPDSVQAADDLGACGFIHKGGDWKSTYSQILMLLNQPEQVA